MGIRVDVEPSLVWDNGTRKMVKRSAVTVHMVGNKGTIFASAGPMYAVTAAEVFEATQTLRSRLVAHLPGIDRQPTRDPIIGAHGFDDDANEEIV